MVYFDVTFRNLVKTDGNQLCVEWALKEYQSLQLIQSSFNGSLGKGFMPAVIFGLSSVSTTSLFALISFYDQLNSVAIGIIVCKYFGLFDDNAFRFIHFHKSNHFEVSRLLETTFGNTFVPISEAKDYFSVSTPSIRWNSISCQIRDNADVFQRLN